MEDPVGTGPYRLAEWRRSQRIVLEANPHFRDVRYPAPGADAADAAVARGLTGRRLPLTPRVEVTIVEEAQPRLLSFRRGDLDYVEVPTSISNTVLAGDTLLPELSARGVRLHRTVDPALAFVFFNLDDPVVGGYTPERVALRRAITMARDRKSASAILSHGQATPATSWCRRPCRATSRRSRSGTPTTPRRRAPCSTASATATGTATAGASSRTARR